MGISACSSIAPLQSACDVQKTCGLHQSLRRCRNSKAFGLGGKLKKVTGHTACVVIAFDYEGYPAEELSACGPLASSSDARAFADLAGASRAEVLEFYDQPGILGSLGFPLKSRVLKELQRLGSSLGPEDAVVIFFAGHSKQIHFSEDVCSTPHSHEALCFVQPDGSPDFLLQLEVADVLYETFHPQTQLLMLTQCHYGNGSMCDLSRPELVGRPICQIAAVQTDLSVLTGKIRTSSTDNSCGGASFARTLFDVIQHTSRESRLSIVQVFNACLVRSENYQEESSDLRFERTHGFDPDTFPWPLMPQRGWQVPKAFHKAQHCSSYPDANIWGTRSSITGHIPLAFRRSLNGGA